jgi:hypothetical protein
MVAFALKRVDAAQAESEEAVEAAQTSQEQFHGETIGTSNIATVLILVFVLFGVVGLIVLFFVKSSIR